MPIGSDVEIPDDKIVNDDKEDSEELTLLKAVSNEGTIMVDATAFPQDIAYPTDLNLLNDAREKSEELIDVLYEIVKERKEYIRNKPRTYREIARKDFLKIAQKKRKTHKEIRNGIRKQFCYLNRNIRYLHGLLLCIKHIPLYNHQ